MRIRVALILCTSKPAPQDVWIPAPSCILYLTCVLQLRCNYSQLCPKIQAQSCRITATSHLASSPLHTWVSVCHRNGAKFWSLHKWGASAAIQSSNHLQATKSGMRWTCYLNGGYLVGNDVGGGSWVPLDFMLLLLLLLEPWWFLRSTMPLGSFCAAPCSARTPWLLCGASDCPADCETSHSQPTAFVLITGLLGRSRGLLLLLSFLKCPTEGWVDIPCNWVDISSAMYVLTPPLSSSLQEFLLSLTNSIAFACCQPCVISLDNLKSQILPPWT